MVIVNLQVTPRINKYINTHFYSLTLDTKRPPLHVPVTIEQPIGNEEARRRAGCGCLHSVTLMGRAQAAASSCVRPQPQELGIAMSEPPLCIRPDSIALLLRDYSSIAKDLRRRR